MISNLLMATGGLLAAFAPEFFTFVACRVLAGFAIAGVEVDGHDHQSMRTKLMTMTTMMTIGA